MGSTTAIFAFLRARTPATLWLAAFALAGATLGLGAWRSDGFGWLPILLFPFWGAARTKARAWMLFASYYLAGSRSLPMSAAVFFGESSSHALGVGLWVASATLLAVPWALLRPVAGESVPTSVFRAAGAIVAVSLPPLGLFGWLNPLLAAGYIIPGTGVIGLVVFGIVGGVSAHTAAHGWRHLVMVCILALLAVVPARIAPLDVEPSPPAAWVAVQTELGQISKAAYGVAARQFELFALLGEQGRQAGSKTYILPETIGGTFNGPVAKLWGDHGVRLAARFDSTYLVGMEVPSGSNEYRNSLIKVSSAGLEELAWSRQPVPVSMWHPWDKTSPSAQADWFHASVADVAGVRASVLLCYEEFLVFPILTDFIADKPTAILAVFNGWWVRGSGTDVVQRLHAEAWARIFGVPLLRVGNR